MNTTTSDSLLTLPNVLGVVDGCKPDGPRKWVALCPGHLDRKPSLSIELGHNGYAIFTCRSHQCDVAPILLDKIKQQLVAGTLSHVIPPPDPLPQTKRTKPQLNVPASDIEKWCDRLQDELSELFSGAWDYAGNRGLTADVLKSLKIGLRDHRIIHTSDPAERNACSDCAKLAPVIAIPRYKRGELRGVKYRALAPSDSRHKWTQEPGSSACQFIYGIDNPGDPFFDDVIFIGEGEHEALLMRSLGLNAVAILGTSGVPKELSGEFAEDLEVLKREFSFVVLIPDGGNDAGRRVMQKLSEWLGEFPHSIVTVPDGHKDFGDYYQHDRSEAEDWIKTIRDTEPMRTTREPVEKIASKVIATVVEDDSIRDYPYPMHAWDGTVFGRYAQRKCKNNGIPPQFPLNSLLTVTGAVIADRLVLYNRDKISTRFYTIQIASAQSGKSTSSDWALSVFSKHGLLSGRTESIKFENIGAVYGGVGSDVGLFNLAGKCPRVLLFSDEIRQLFGKWKTPNGAGESTLAVICGLYDSTTPPSNHTKTSKEPPERILLSLLGNITEDNWETAFDKNVAGSGLYTRLNVCSGTNLTGYERRSKNRPQSAARAVLCGGVKVVHRRNLVP